MTRRILALLVFSLGGAAILIALGIWQMQRLDWKEGLIAEVEGRLAADPVALPEAPDPGRDAYLRVAVEGWPAGDEIHVLTTVRPWGPGFRVVAPYALAGSERRVLVDLGYVPEAMKDPGERPIGPASRDQRPVRIVGALFWPDETDFFTPEPDLDRNIWFARDGAAMAGFYEGTAGPAVETFLIVADAHRLRNGTDWPRAQRLGVGLRNDHLEYALTWFSLAAVWIVMGGLVLRREIQRGRA